MKNDHTFVYKFFLFSLAMPERMAKYLEKMRKKGYKLVEIRYSCIFVFKKQEIREDLKYVILTDIIDTIWNTRNGNGMMSHF